LGDIGVVWLLLLTAQWLRIDLPRQGLAWDEQGLAAWNQGQYEEAERDYRQALDIWRKLGREFESHAVVTSMNLGQALCGMGKWAEGRRLFGEALGQARSLAPKHLRTVILLNMLGSVNSTLGDEAHASEAFGEALAIEREIHPESLELVRTLDGLAGVSLRKGDYDAALPAAQEALSLVLRLKEADATDVAAAYGMVATIHRDAGRPERALPLFRTARTLFEKNGRADTPRFASLLIEEALALRDDGQMAAAQRNLLRASAIASACAGCGLLREAAKGNLDELRIRNPGRGAGAARGNKLRRAVRSAPPRGKDPQPKRVSAPYAHR
jgi:tetratricopeptide (TPR) repeat protein